MKNAFKEIVKATLQEGLGYDQPNLGSETCCDLLAEKVEERIKEKFHIFRINKILTGDCGDV